MYANNAQNLANLRSVIEKCKLRFEKMKNKKFCVHACREQRDCRDSKIEQLLNKRLEVCNLDDCIFCQIIRGVETASIVYSDEKVLAFMDITPVNLGHLLVIPKAHAAQLSELDPKIGGHMFKVAMRIAEALRRSGIKCEGVNLFLADGEAAFQDVFHVHLHVIPRFRGDGFGLKLGPKYGIRPDRKELDEVAEKIKHDYISRGVT